MVRDSQRGWELPGGKLEEGEEIEVGALRELFEETGLLGTAKAYDSHIVEGVTWFGWRSMRSRGRNHGSPMTLGLRK